MKKLSESVWGNIRRKSLGQEVRTEDDVNRLRFDDFYDYITERYKFEVKPYFNKDSKSMFMLPLFWIDKEKNQSEAFIFFQNDNIKHLRVTPELEKGYEHLYDIIKEKYSIQTYNPNQTYISRDKLNIISPKDGSETTNAFCLEVFDFILENVDDKETLMVEKIKE